MKNIFLILVFQLCSFSLASQGITYSDTVYVDSYKIPKELTPDDLADEIKSFLKTRNYVIIEDSPIETSERPDSFKRNNAGWISRNIFGRKDLVEYPFSIKHTLTFDQNRNGRNYVVIFSFAALESKILSEDNVEDIQDDAMKSAKKIAKDEFNDLKKIVKNLNRF